MSFPNKAEQVGVLSPYSINPSDIGLNWGTPVSVSTNLTAGAYLGNGIVIYGTVGGHIFRSVDYGVTFTDLGDKTGAGDEIFYISYLGNGIVCFTSTTHVFRSTDFGITWTDLGAKTGGSNAGNLIYCGNGIAVLVDDGGNVYRSTDFGITYSGVAGNPISSTVIDRVIYYDNGIITFADDNRHIFRSTDFGVTWTDLGIKLSTTQHLNIGSYLSNGIAFYGDDNGHIIRTVDNGLTWTDLGALISNSPQTSVYLGNGITILGDDGVTGRVWRSTNYGLTWTDLGAKASTNNIINILIYLGNGVVTFGDDGGDTTRSDISYKTDENIPVMSVGMSGGVGNTAGTTGLAYQQLVIVGGTNVTLSQSITSGSATITINANNQSVQSGSIIRDVIISGNTTGTTADITSGTLTLAGGSNITLSQAGNIITISSGTAAGAPTLSLWQNSYGASKQDVFANFNTFALVELNPSPGNVFPGNMTVSTMLFDISFSANATIFNNSNMYGTFRFGIYTLNASTLSILNSGSTIFSTDFLDNVTANLWMSIVSSQCSASLTFSGTQYYLGYLFHSTSDSAGTDGGPFGFSLVGNQYLRTNQRSGTFNGTIGGTTTMGHIPFAGVSISSLNSNAALPSSIQLSQLQKTGSNYAIIPHIVFMNLSSAF